MAKQVTESGEPLFMSDGVYGEYLLKPTDPTPAEPGLLRRNRALPSFRTKPKIEDTAVGILEHNSAIEVATNWFMIMAIIHPQTMPPVPTYLVNDVSKMFVPQGESKCSCYRWQKTQT